MVITEFSDVNMMYPTLNHTEWLSSLRRWESQLICMYFSDDQHTSTSSIHDKRSGKLTETIYFYLLAIAVVKYCRHQPNINQFPSEECASERLYAKVSSPQPYLSGVSLLLCFGSTFEFILLLILSNPQSEGK